MPVAAVTDCVNQEFCNNPKSAEVCERLLSYLGSLVKDGESVVQWFRMRDLADYVQLSLRKDRNASNGIDFIMQEDQVSV